MSLHKHAASSLKPYSHQPRFLTNAIRLTLPFRRTGIANIDSHHTVVQGNDLTLAGECHHALGRGRTERELGFLPGAFRRISEMNSDSYLLLHIIRSALISRSNAESIPVVAQRERLFRERRAQHLRVNAWSFPCIEH